MSLRGWFLFYVLTLREEKLVILESGQKINKVRSMTILIKTSSKIIPQSSIIIWSLTLLHLLSFICCQFIREIDTCDSFVGST